MYVCGVFLNIIFKTMCTYTIVYPNSKRFKYVYRCLVCARENYVCDSVRICDGVRVF